MKIQIERDEDLNVLEKVLADLGLTYSFEEADQSVSSISNEATEGIHAGMNDLQEGRILSHKEAMERIDRKVAQMRAKHVGRV